MDLERQMVQAARRRYDLNGLSVAVEATEDALARFLDPILSPFIVAESDRSDWTITIIRTDAITMPDHSVNSILDGTFPEGIPFILTDQHGRRALSIPDRLTMTSQRAERSTHILVTPAGVSTLQGTVTFWLINEILAACHRYLLHGACLVKTKTNEAFALFAPSGTGKTTTALALARNGLGVAGDDALVLESDTDGFYVWGIPRPIKVHHRSADLLPWLQPVLKNWEADEQAIRLGDLKQIVTVASASRRRCAEVIVLARPNMGGHWAEAITKTETLIRILTDNLRIAPAGLDADGQAAFAAISGSTRHAWCHAKRNERLFAPADERIDRGARFPVGFV